jgi:hypothetical protein
MNINEQAELDLEMMLEDDQTGFGSKATIQNPSGTESKEFIGSYNSIHKMSDPAGLEIINQTPSFVIRKSSLDAAIASGDFSQYPTKQWYINVEHLGETITGFLSHPPHIDNRARTVTFIFAIK